MNYVMAEGTVKWYNDEQGYGFITPDGGGRDLYVDNSELRGVQSLDAEQRVEFQVGRGSHGPQAEAVRLL